jgi:hypothetical protein
MGGEMNKEQQCTFCGGPIKQTSNPEVRSTPAQKLRREKLIEAGLPVFYRCQACTSAPGRAADASGAELGRRIRETLRISSSGLSSRNR